MTVKRTRQIGPGNKRRCKTQKGRNLLGTLAKLGIKALTSTGLLKKGLGIGVKTDSRINSDIRKKLVDEGIKSLPQSCTV